MKKAGKVDCVVERSGSAHQPLAKNEPGYNLRQYKKVKVRDVYLGDNLLYANVQYNTDKRITLGT